MLEDQDELRMGGVSTFGGAGTVNNAFTGQLYERAPFDGFGSLYITSSVAKTFTASLNVGGDQVADGMTINAQNRVPIEPDDVVLKQFKYRKGDLLRLQLIGTAAGDVFWAAVLQPGVWVEG